MVWIQLKEFFCSSNKGSYKDPNNTVLLVAISIEGAARNQLKTSSIVACSEKLFDLRISQNSELISFLVSFH